jgi:ankyrin repeat protein
MSTKHYDEFVAAIRAGDSQLVSLLISVGANANASLRKGMFVQTLPLVLAASLGHVDTVETLLNAGASIDGVDEGGESACHAAVAAQRVDVVRLLVRRGIDVSLLDYRGRTALHMAAIVDNEELAILLLESGAPLNSHMTLCRVAAMSPAVVCALLNRHANIRNVRDVSGSTPAHLAAVARDDSACALLLRVLLRDVGVDVDALDRQDQSCAALCAMKGNVESLRVVIDAGADVDLVDKLGRSPLHHAAMQANPLCAMMLLAAGADVRPKDRNGRVAFDCARNRLPWLQWRPVVPALMVFTNPRKSTTLC